MTDTQQSIVQIGRIDLLVNGPVARMVLNNPAKLNAISYSMWREIAAGLKQLGGDPAVRCLVIEGQGARSFCTGADISEKDELNRAGDAGHDDPTYPALLALQSFPKPTIASIAGYCIGAGMVLASACDFRVATGDARFSFPAARLGLAPGYWAIKRLTEIVGTTNAKRILFLAGRFDAVEALRLAFIDEIATEGGLEAAISVWADKIAANAPLSLAAVKFAMELAVWGDDQTDPEAYGVLERACAQSRDYAEGLRAFAEKRQPRFLGQ